MLAVVLSVLSYGTPGLEGGKPTIIPRGSEVWQGEAELLISQEGFPYGRAVQQVEPGKGTRFPLETIGDFNYMASLSSVYAALANGNSVQQQAAREAGVPLCPSIDGLWNRGGRGGRRHQRRGSAAADHVDLFGADRR